MTWKKIKNTNVQTKLLKIQKLEGYFFQRTRREIVYENVFYIEINLMVENNFKD